MSVIADGPAGYDYQYLASVYDILYFLKQDEVAEIYIDRENLTLSYKRKAINIDG